MYKLYYPKELLFENSRSSLFPLLKPFIKGQDYTDEERISQYGVSEKTFCFVNYIQQADFVIIPMTWNYYRKNNLFKKVLRFIESYSNKIIVSYTSGDFGVKTPEYYNLFVLRENDYRSKLSENHIGIPIFIEDPQKKYYSSSEVTPITYSEKPIVGFCGQSNFTILTAIFDVTRVIFKNTLHYINLRNELPQKIMSSSFLRGKILHLLKKSPKITDNFIERKKYRAGVKTNEDRAKTTIEFYDNMKKSQYIVCVRGGGNFSVRIYETLAMGRIPLFVNTDCLLPLNIHSEWKHHVVWIENNDLSKISHQLYDHNKKMNAERIEKMTKSNRKFWEEKLTLNGYFYNLFLKLK